MPGFESPLGVQIVTAVLAAMTLFIFAFWLMRRKETQLLWLSAIGLVGVLLNLLSGLAANMLSWLLLIFLVSFALLYSRLRVDRIAALMVCAAIAAAIAHDMGLQYAWWSGVGASTVPYVSLVAFTTFAIFTVRNILNALTAKENLSQVLGMRIETTKANLIASESARRSLEISNAITKERERMMREIHDGIGSSLVAALASAERQGRSSSTAVIALKSALTDLRIAVDSLEPVEGNVTTLLANLRYRLEPEMKKAGIGFMWAVEDVPELPWLDSPNALHVLRIFQEAFGNILGHANASKITVGCRQEYLDGKQGIRIEVSDDGEGFDPSVPPRGRGRKNMIERAEALGGRLGVYSSPGSGSSTVLWLPIERT